MKARFEQCSKVYEDEILKKSMKFKVVCRKIRDYIRYDLKEIAFPSSLPDPPHVQQEAKLTWRDWCYILKEASRIYAASWVRDISEEGRRKDQEKAEEGGVDKLEEKDNDGQKEPSTLEDLAVAARGGMETLRPALQRVYMMKASVYKDALKNFVQGYQEGIQQVMEKKDDSSSLWDEKKDTSGKSS